MITASVILSSDNYSEFDLYKNGTKLTPTTSSANIKTYEDIPRDNDSFVVKVMVDGVEMSYNITVSYSTVNDVNVDKLVEDFDCKKLKPKNAPYREIVINSKIK